MPDPTSLGRPNQSADPIAGGCGSVHLLRPPVVRLASQLVKLVLLGFQAGLARRVPDNESLAPLALVSVQAWRTAEQGQVMAQHYLMPDLIRGWRRAAYQASGHAQAAAHCRTAGSSHPRPLFRPCAVSRCSRPLHPRRIAATRDSSPGSSAPAAPRRSPRRAARRWLSGNQRINAFTRASQCSLMT